MAVVWSFVGLRERKRKKRVSHFADSEEKLSGYTEDCGEELC